jgi:8-oxo-dGTP pyrophosphatase MutT (NUDIX family)
MSIDKQLHPAHVAILRVLFRPSARFNELQKASELASDHFNFYLKQLLDEAFITKDGAAYSLTFKGKEFANRFDTDARTVERQPKVAVCLMIRREDGTQLVQQRLKQPFYGYWGRPTGKVRWGETILEAAARELKEETGLTADMQFKSVYHKMDFNKQTGEMLEDKIFFIIDGTNPRGDFIEAFEGGRNAWMTQEEYLGQELTFGDNAQRNNEIQSAPHIPIVEFRHTYAPEHY